MASFARAASRVGALLRSQEAALGRAGQQLAGQQARSFAAGGHGAHDSVKHAGLEIHKAAKWHVYAGQGFAGLMWFWIFYRFYNDFDHFVYGPAAHLEHDLEHEKEHGEGEHH